VNRQQNILTVHERLAMSKLFVLILAASWPMAAQSNFATLSGRVQDPTQAPIPGARAKLIAKATGSLRETATNAEGLFEAPNLAPGEYSLEVSAAGFADQERDIVLEVGQHMGIDLSLQLGARSETVEVVASTENLKTQDASIGEVVEPKSIEDLPLNGRMLIDLALTVPDAHAGHGAQTGDMSPLYWRPGQRSAITIGGNRPDANYYLLDGVTNTDPTFNTMNLSLSPDAVQEFQVQTGSYSAELGGAGGGQVNVVTRQGGSQFHGTGYEFLRNNKFDARTWNEMPGTSYLRQNNYGGSLGGPVYGKRTFFFANYDRDGHRADSRGSGGRLQRKRRGHLRPHQFALESELQAGAASDYRESADPAQPVPERCHSVRTPQFGGCPDASELRATPEHHGRHGLWHDDEWNAGGVRRRRGFQ
jgi:hypothetical protein